MTLSSTTVQSVALCAYAATILQWAPANAANILAVETSPCKSHWNIMRSVLRVLTDHGHTVTVFTPFADGDRNGYTEVKVETAVQLGLTAGFMTENFGTTRKLMINQMNNTREGCDMIYGHRRMMEILDGSATGEFDLVITEPLNSECVAYVATVLRVPLIYVIPSPIITYLERPLTGHAPNPAAVAHILSRRGVIKTFIDRFINVVLTVYGSTLKWYAEQHHRFADSRPYDDVDLVRPSVIFTNTHFITEPARPLTPDVVQIGGVHLTPPEPIPTDILEFIDDAPNGVIYFTFGSIVLMSSLPENVQSAFREAFARVSQKVLWKYEGEFKNKPNNVMIRKWFPQRDILLHHNVKLFISHGGISGIYEAVDAGVPILGFPIFYDQSRNIDNLVNARMAISMDLLSVTEETLSNAILKIFKSNEYQKNAEITSKRFKDRPMSPAESIIYWTEYVLRHKGAPHLKSHALSLSWYQYFLVDVITSFLFSVLVILFIIYYYLKIMYTYIYSYIRIMKAKRE